MQARHTHICFFFALLLLGAGLGACDTTGGRLRAIDAIIEDDPARAYAELQALPVGPMSAADSAYFALLYTQAQVKNNVAVDSDSLIGIAYKHYRPSGNDDLRRRAH